MGTINDLQKRVLEISYKSKVGHLGSCLTALPIISMIYMIKKEEDIFVLSSGHAAIALYVVLEREFEHINAETLFVKHGVHPNRDPFNEIYCSSGSLGCGLPIAIGLALAEPKRKVWVLISDGECDEGSVWESLRFINDHKIKNMKILVNYNGISAYQKIKFEPLKKRLWAFYKGVVIVDSSKAMKHFKFLKGIDSHYYIMTKEDYETYVR